ncbi:hypothetical protein AC249_AIPGENE5066 [Exaiptasia diaphana]|nr:hypothetical protein AC249_AIPGENE5066 [Exaiptasia diaphana]
MAEALLEMELLDLLDSTDDWADDILNEIQNDVEEITSTEVEEVFEQVSLAGLIDICTRISDAKINITEESESVMCNRPSTIPPFE